MLSLKIKTEVAELERIFAAVDELAVQNNWPGDFIFRINLVVEEVAMNCIKYCHTEGMSDFEITMDPRDDVLTIEIIDAGRPFDPLTDAPEADTDSDIEDRAIGGLGIHLVRTMTDDMRYRREADQNHLTLIMHKPS